MSMSVYSNTGMGSQASPRPTADAWCVFELDGSNPPVLIDSYGVSGVTKAGPFQGAVRVLFSDPSRFQSGAYATITTTETSNAPGIGAPWAAYSHGTTLASPGTNAGGLSAYCDISTIGFNPISLNTPSEIKDFTNTDKRRINAAFFCLRSDADTGKMSVENYAPDTINMTLTAAPSGASGGLVAVPNAEVAPDGSRTAVGIRVTANSLGVRKLIRYDIPTKYSSNRKQWNGSIYIKAGEVGRVLTGASANVFFIDNSGPNWGSLHLNLETGVNSVSGTNALYSSHSVEPVGNGWYRVSISHRTGPRISPNDGQYPGAWNFYMGLPADNISASGTSEQQWSGNGAIEVYLWGAQMEEGTRATPFIPNTGSANPTTAPVVGNQEVLVNHTPGLCGFGTSTRQNLIQYSEDFLTGWSKARVRVNSGFTAPDGTTTAYKVVEQDPSETTPQSGNYYKSLYVAPLAGSTVGTGTYTFSVHAKAAERQYFTFADGSRGQFGLLIVDLLTGKVTQNSNNQSVKVVSLGDGWWRIAVTLNSAISPVPSAFGEHRFGFAGTSGPVESNNSSIYGPIYAGVSGSGIYAWGAQVETGTVFGDYVKTSGTIVGTKLSRVAAGQTYSSHLVNYEHSGEATAWGTIVVPPAKGSVASGAYLENSYGVSGVSATNNNQDFEVRFTTLMDTNSYCVIAATEQEPSLGTETAVGTVGSIPPTEEFALLDLTAATAGGQRTRSKFTVRSRRRPRSVNLVNNSLLTTGTSIDWLSGGYEFTNTRVDIDTETSIPAATRTEMKYISQYWVKCVKTSGAGSNGRVGVLTLNATPSTNNHYNTTTYAYSASGISNLDWFSDNPATAGARESSPYSSNSKVRKLHTIWQSLSGTTPTIMLRSAITDALNSTVYLAACRTTLVEEFGNRPLMITDGREQRINFMVFGGRARYGTG
jgi:hypothetical protein